MKRLAVLVFAGPALVSSAPAPKITCAVDQRTDMHMCYAPADLKESDGIRTAGLYTGGPKGVRKTTHFIAVNCATGVMHLKDKDGVSFGGTGPGGGTQMSRDLQRYMCEEPAPKSSR